MTSAAGSRQQKQRQAKLSHVVEGGKKAISAQERALRKSSENTDSQIDGRQNRFQEALGIMFSTSAPDSEIRDYVARNIGKFESPIDPKEPNISVVSFRRKEG